MKKYAILFLMGLLLASFSTASASGLKGKIALSGNGGLGLPLGDFADEDKGAAKSGFGLGGNFEYFLTDNVSIGGNFTYRKHDVKTEGLGEGLKEIEQSYPGAMVAVDIDGDHKITSFGAFGKYLFTASPQVSPYLKFGLGMGKLKSVLDLSGSVFYEGEAIAWDASTDIDVDFRAYVDMGGGILYQLSESIALTGEVLYTHLMTDGANGEMDMEITVSGMGQHIEEKEKGKGEYGVDTDYISAFVGLTILLGGTR
jgi:opacity protein-like surface antigen